MSLSNIVSAANLNIPQLPPVPTFPSIPSPPQIPNLSSINNGNFTNPPRGPTSATDVVGIFDDSGNQILDLARPIKANVSPSSKIMDHPIETGATISDFQIFLPVEIELSLLCTSSEYRSVYQQINTAFQAGATLTVLTKANAYVNMLIQAIPHEETPEMFDVLPVAVKLREVIQVTTQYQALAPSDVLNPNDQSTVSTGETSPQTSTIAQNIVHSTVNALRSVLPNLFAN